MCNSGSQSVASATLLVAGVLLYHLFFFKNNIFPSGRHGDICPSNTPLTAKYCSFDTPTARAWLSIRLQKLPQDLLSRAFLVCEFDYETNVLEETCKHSSVSPGLLGAISLICGLSQ